MFIQYNIRAHARTQIASVVTAQKEILSITDTKLFFLTSLYFYNILNLFLLFFSILLFLVFLLFYDIYKTI